jgi:hypothetical protein
VGQFELLAVQRCRNSYARVETAGMWTFCFLATMLALGSIGSLLYTVVGSAMFVVIGTLVLSPDERKMKSLYQSTGEIRVPDSLQTVDAWIVARVVCQVIIACVLAGAWAAFIVSVSVFFGYRGSVAAWLLWSCAFLANMAGPFGFGQAMFNASQKPGDGYIQSYLTPIMVSYPVSVICFLMLAVFHGKIMH